MSSNKTKKKEMNFYIDKYQNIKIYNIDKELIN